MNEQEMCTVDNDKRENEMTQNVCIQKVMGNDWSICVSFANLGEKLSKKFDHVDVIMLYSTEEKVWMVIEVAAEHASCQVTF